MLTWRTTLLFLWPISAAKKGHLEAPGWAEGVTGWPAGSWDSPFCLRATYGQNKFRTQNYTEYVFEPKCFIWYNVATKLTRIKKNIFFFYFLFFLFWHTNLHWRTQCPQSWGGRRRKRRSRGPVPLTGPWAWMPTPSWRDIAEQTQAENFWSAGERPGAHAPGMGSHAATRPYFSAEKMIVWRYGKKLEFKKLSQKRYFSLNSNRKQICYIGE